MGIIDGLSFAVTLPFCAFTCTDALLVDGCSTAFGCSGGGGGSGGIDEGAGVSNFCGVPSSCSSSYVRDSSLPFSSRRLYSVRADDVDNSPLGTPTD